MTKGKKIAFWGLLGIGVFIFLVFLTLIILPQFLNLNFVRSRISQELKHHYQVSCQIGSLSVEFLPRPKIVLKDTRISSSTLQAFFPVAYAHPKLWPILHKRFELEDIVLEKAELKLNLPQEVRLFKRQKKRGFFRAQVQLKDASLEVFKNKSLLFKASSINLQADIKDSQVVLETYFKTPFGQGFSLQAHSGKSGLKGQLRVKNLSLEQIPFILRSKKIVKSQIDLDLVFHFKSPTEFTLDYQGVASCLKFQSSGVSLKDAVVKGHLLRSKDCWQVKLSQLALAHPQVEAQGWFNIEPKRYHIAYDFQGKELDVTGWRKLLCEFFPQNKSVKAIFKIVKAGRVKIFHVSQTALNKEQWETLKTFRLQAEAAGARIDIPEVGLKIYDGQGPLVIKEGVLYGEHLSGVMEGAELSAARIAIGIKSPHKDLNIEGTFRAPLVTGLFFLKKFVRNDLVQREVKLIAKAEGVIYGKLVIAGTYKRVEVKIKGDLVRARIAYQRLPYQAFIDKVSFAYEKERISWEGLQGHLGHSVVRKSEGRVDFSTPQVCLNVRQFSGKLIAHELDPWFKKQGFFQLLYRTFDLPKGEIDISSAHLRYRFGQPASLYYAFHFKVKDAVLFLSFLPQKVQIEGGQGFISPKIIKFNHTKGHLGDGDFFLSGEIKMPFTEQRQIELEGRGELTSLLQDWIYDFANLPDSLKIKVPAMIEDLRLKHQPEHTYLQVKVLISPNIHLGFELNHSPQQCSIKNGYLTEDHRKCYLCLNLDWQKGPIIDLNFKGSLSSHTLDAILVHNEYLNGFFKGEIEGKIDLTYLGNSSLKGNLLVEGLSNINGFKKLQVGKMEVYARGQEIEIKKCALSLKKTTMDVQGRARFKEDFLKIEGRIGADVVDLNEIKGLFSEASPQQAFNLKINAFLDVKMGLFQGDNLHLREVAAFVTVKDSKQVKMEILKGNYCNLNVTGFINTSSAGTALDISLKAEKQSLNELCSCLWQRDHLFEANYSLKGSFKAQGKERPIVENSAGNLIFHSEKGRIYKLTLLAKIFSLINVIEIFKGRLPDLTREGFYYKHLDIQATLQNGILHINSFVIDSSAMKIVGQGRFNLSKSELKMTILVAPLRTIDLVLSNIPILGRILTGKSKTFISVPLEVKGQLQDPQVVFLPPAAIGKGIFGLMERIIGAPIEIFKPFTN